MKKLASILLVLVVILSMGSFAVAEGERDRKSVV